MARQTTIKPMRTCKRSSDRNWRLQELDSASGHHGEDSRSKPERRAGQVQNAEGNQVRIRQEADRYLRKYVACEARRDAYHGSYQQCHRKVYRNEKIKSVQLMKWHFAL